MKKYKNLIIAAAIGFTILAVILVYLKLNKKDPSELTLFGNIEIRQADLSFRVEGRVMKLFKEEGDEVKKGELLALMDDVTYKAKYEKSLADIRRYKAQSANYYSIYKRHRALCADGTTSKERCDEILKDKNESRAMLESEIKQSKIYKDDWDNTKIYAPNDGIVTTRVVEEGMVVGLANPVYTISLNRPVWIRAYVGEENLGNIKYNMKATVLTDTTDPHTGEKRKYEGRIGYISPVAEFTPKTVQTEELRTDLVYRIRVYVDKTDKYLRQGMPTTIIIDLKQKDENGRGSTD